MTTETVSYHKLKRMERVRRILEPEFFGDELTEHIAQARDAMEPAFTLAQADCRLDLARWELRNLVREAETEAHKVSTRLYYLLGENEGVPSPDIPGLAELKAEDDAARKAAARLREVATYAEEAHFLVLRANGQPDRWKSEEEIRLKERVRASFAAAPESA